MQNFVNKKDFKNTVVKNAQYMSETVGSTLGPHGKNVLLKAKDGNPLITKDGVTVAKFLKGKTAEDDAIINIIRQASLATAREAGDGTTSTVVLASDLLATGIEKEWHHIENSFNEFYDFVVDKLKENSFQIESIEDIENIATLSANNDRKLGHIVADAVDSVGKNGSITIQKSPNHDTFTKTYDGFQFQSGYFSSRFITNEKSSSVDYGESNIFITDFKLTNLEPLLPMLALATRENKPLIIIADDFDGEVIASFMANALKGTLKICPIKAPKYGQSKVDFLEDLADVTGGTFFSRIEFASLNDFDFNKATPAIFGKINQITIDRKSTNIISALNNNEKVLNKINHLKDSLRAANEAEGREIQERITRLASTMSIIYVGGSSDIEIEEKRHRIEDAIEAVKSAQEFGYQIGGTFPLLKIIQDYQPDNQNIILLRSCYSIIRKIIENGNYNISFEEIFEFCKNNKDNKEIGLDFLTKQKINYKEKGIIEPTKVTISILKNTISIASVLLATSCSFCEL